MGLYAIGVEMSRGICQPAKAGLSAEAISEVDHGGASGHGVGESENEGCRFGTASDKSDAFGSVQG